MKAEPNHLARLQELFQLTHQIVNQFQIFYFDEQSLAVATRLRNQLNTRKRYADILLAAQAIAGNYVLVTRNTKDFRDLLPASQLQNWVDDEAH